MTPIGHGVLLKCFWISNACACETLASFVLNCMRWLAMRMVKGRTEVLFATALFYFYLLLDRLNVYCGHSCPFSSLLYSTGHRFSHSGHVNSSDYSSHSCCFPNVL